MATAQQKYDHIRDIRLVLGDAIRHAHDQMEPMLLMVEQGYRWEQDEMVSAIEIADELSDGARQVDAAVASFDAKGLKAASKRRLQEARMFLGRGIKSLDSIDGAQMVALAQKWEDEGLGLDKAHEAYFLQRFTVAMRILRLAWNKLFYATQTATIRHIKLTVRQESAWYDPMSGIREAVQNQARELADKSGKHVEVLDTDGDVVFVAGPGASARAIEGSAARKRARKPRKVSAKRMESNRSRGRGEVEDLIMLDELWTLPY